MRVKQSHQMMLWERTSKVWKKLPVETQNQCHKLVIDLLVKTVIREAKERRHSDE